MVHLTRYLFTIALLAGVAALLFVATGAHAQFDRVEITMLDDGYEPRNVEISQGDTVVFINVSDLAKWPASDIHPTHNIYPEFDPREPVPAGESWEFRFDQAGIWRYHDHIDPRIRGSIEVAARDDYVAPDEPPAKSSWIDDAGGEIGSPEPREEGIRGAIRRFFAAILRPFRAIFGFLFPSATPSDNIAAPPPPATDDGRGYVPIDDLDYDDAIDEYSEDIFRSDDALYSYIRKFSPARATLRLHELSATFGNCHDRAHDAGRLTYEIHGADSFQLCSAECHSGCYHGATEAYFRDHGTANLSENLQVICSHELNPFFSHQCLHGIGHGLMAWAGYEIFEALDACDLLPSAGARGSCYTGVFMENIVGGLVEETGHFTEYVSDDPLYPCTIVDEKYASSCYFLQTSRMVQLYGADFRKVADGCLLAPERFQHSCFSSMGRDVGGNNKGNPDAMIAACGFAPPGALRVACLNGAVQDTMWDPSGQDVALRFCRSLNDRNEKDGCYQTIFNRAGQVFSSPESLAVFCDKAEEGYRSQCRSAAGI